MTPEAHQYVYSTSTHLQMGCRYGELYIDDESGSFEDDNALYVQYNMVVGEL